MKKMFAIIILSVTFINISNATDEMTGVRALTRISQFAAEYNNLGATLKDNKPCLFSMEALPVNNHTNIQTCLNMKKYKQYDSSSIKEDSQIGHCFMGINNQTSSTMIVSGGSYDGGAKFILEKKTNGTLKIQGEWEDNEMGPDHTFSCSFGSRD